MQKLLLFVSIGGFAIGVLSRSFFDFGFSFPLFLVVLSVALFLFWLLLARRTLVLFTSILCFAAALGVLRLDLAEGGDAALAPFVGERIRAEGVIVEEPALRERSALLTVDLTLVDGTPRGGRVLVVSDVYPRLSYGDRISLEGVLREPENFETESGRIFNYQAYLRKDGIFWSMLFPEIALVEHGQGNPIKEVLFSIKNELVESFKTTIPEPESSLLGGLLVGARQSLGEDLQETFRRAGIIHIVVLSGYNLTIVADFFMRILSVFPQYVRLSVGATSIALFALMTGASATVVRASIMALLVLLARAVKRPYAIGRALLLAGAAMIVHNPHILIFDPSFQLSFLATVGLIYLAPAIEKRLKLLPTTFQLREFATATIATQIFVLPLLLYLSGEVSLVSLPTNLLVLIFIPLTMLLGFLSGLLGLVSIVLSLPLAYAAYFLLHYELLVSEFFGNLPFATVSTPLVPGFVVFVIYALFALCLLRRRIVDFLLKK